MTPQERLKSFCPEIAAELAQLEAELEPAREAAAAADAAYRVALDHWTDVRRLLARSMPVNPEPGYGISGPLLDRVEGTRDEALRGLRNARGRAFSHVKSIESSIENRRLALRQIEAATAPSKSSIVREFVPRQKETDPVLFDNITMPVKEASGV